MITPPSSHFAPDYEYWRHFETIQVWQAAAMMRGFEPRLLQDVTDRDGNGLDLEDEMQMLKSAFLAGSLGGAAASAVPGNDMHITVASLVPWLRTRGFGTMASGLGGDSTPTGSGKEWTEQKLAELAAFRKTYGTKKAAEKFGISEARIRKLLPRRGDVKPATLQTAWGPPAKLG